MSVPSLEVLIANTPAERDDVFRFRYRMLVEQGRRDMPGADPARQTLTDAADRAAMLIYLKVRGQVAASVRLIVAPALRLPAFILERFELATFLDLPDLTVSLTDYLVVDPDALDAPAANLLMTAAYKIALAKGSGFDFTHAGAGEVAIFERLGYRRYGGNFQDPDFGLRVPMVLPTDDIDHLAQVGSPFLKQSRDDRAGAALVNWFRRTYPDAANAAQPAAMDDQALWSYLTRRLEQTPHHGVPLLLGLEHKDAMRFLKLATVVSCRPGEAIVSKGDMGEEMFVILQGSVEVRDGGQRLAAFGKGGIFGEMAYLNAEPRSADVIAREDAEILIVTQNTMKAAMADMPEVAARILFNMSLILTERLKDTTGRLVEARKTAA